MRNGINNNFGSKGKNLILLNHFALLIIIIFVFCISITEERHRNIIKILSKNKTYKNITIKINEINKDKIIFLQKLI